MWVVMMVGMMAPAAVPMLLLFAGVNAGRRGNVLAFGFGYFAVWTGFSALATFAQWALHQAAMLSPPMKTASPRLAGVILLGAGAYQLTPWKARCLTHCRSPLGFVMTNWHAGKLGAVRMGVSHGKYCLGCCWALMCVLFAVGVMNLVWVAVLTVFVLIEKIGPAGATVARLAGAAIAIGGILLIAGIV
jgi:predicted metal-binding membrane protein